MKKRTLALVTLGSLTMACIGVAALKNTSANKIIGKATGETYSLTINAPLYTGSGESGEGYTYVQTALGNSVKIKYDKLSPYASGINKIKEGSYIEIVNNNDIQGIAGITNVSITRTINKNNCYLSVSYGWVEGDMMNNIDQIAMYTESSNSFDVPNSPSYIRIESRPYAYSYDIDISEIVISYTCQTTTDPYKEGDYCFALVDDHYEVSRYRGHSGSLTIPSEYDGHPVTAIADDFIVDIGKEDITDVTLPESITRIGRNAFNGAENMTTINLDNVIDYDYRAFFDCKKLYANGSVTIRANHIGEDAFCQSGVAIINFESPTNALQIDEDAFANADRLCRVYFPSDLVITIGNTLFRGCDKLDVIYLPESINSFSETNYLEESTFNGCTALVSFNYRGTADQWNSLKKLDSWHKDIPATYVTCFTGVKVYF